MDRGRTVAVIPARYGSTRFPGKPLALLNGVPMIAHVAARAREAGCFDEIVVATDDERIVAAAETAGANAVMTGPARNGTDRVAAAIEAIEADLVVNVQGDEPALPPENLRMLVRFLSAHDRVPLATLSLPGAPDDLVNPNIVKVVCDLQGYALYFSRAAIPFHRNALPGLVRRHVGLYGFRRAALEAFTAWPESDLERCEGLEQLRALAHGMAIRVLDAAGESVAVDTPDDVPRAEAALRALASASAHAHTPSKGGS